MTIELTSKEVKLLSELLNLDMDKIGFEEKEKKVLKEIYYKINPNQRPKEQKVPVEGVIIQKVKPFKINLS